jgi:hypothetical protein
MNANADTSAAEVRAPTSVQDALAQSKTFLQRQTDHLTTLAAGRVTAFADDRRLARGPFRQSDTEYLRNADSDRLALDAGDLARRNPLIAGGVALVAGVAVARFLKTSGSRNTRSASANTRYGE